MWKQLQLHIESKTDFRVELGESKKSAEISKTRAKKIFFVMYLRPAKF